MIRKRNLACYKPYPSLLEGSAGNVSLVLLPRFFQRWCRRWS